MLNTSSKVMKYLLFLFNFVFVLTGISLITVGIIIKSDTENYQNAIQDEDYVSAANLLIFLGIFVFFIAFFGCCGAIRENHCMIVTFSVIMVAIFVAEVAIGVTGYMLRAEATDVLNKSLNETMYKYNVSVPNEDTRLWDEIQGNLKCCGVNNYTDWMPVLHKLPMTCCGPQLGKVGVLTCTTESKDLHQTPCIVALGAIVKENASAIGLTGIIIAIVQLLGVVFSCYLAYSIRNNYESV